MRTLCTVIVAALALHAVDEQFNADRYTRAATAMLSEIVHSYL